MVSCGEVDDAKHLRLHSSDPVDDLLDVRDRPSLQCSGGRVESHIVKGEAPLLRHAFRCRLRYQVHLAPFCSLRFFDNA